MFNRSESETYEGTGILTTEVFGNKIYGLAEIGYDTVRLTSEGDAVQKQAFLLMLESKGLNVVKADGITVRYR